MKLHEWILAIIFSVLMAITVNYLTKRNELYYATFNIVMLGILNSKVLDLRKKLDTPTKEGEE